MARTITHLYDTYDEATRAVRMLEDAGIRAGDISILANDRDQRYAPTTLTGSTAPGETLSGREPLVGGAGVAREGDALRDTEEAGTGAGAGASVGTVLGGGAGLLAGIGALAIPGVGPVVAAGWLIATLTGAGLGAGVGGLLGSLVGAGHSEADAHVYAEGVRRGGTLVSVRVDEADAPRVESLLDNSGRVDVGTRGAEYRAAGWERFDETRPVPTAGAEPVVPAGIGTTTTAGQVQGDPASGLPSANPLADPVDVERQRLGSSTHA